MIKQKILIVDDDENIAELISLYLMKECFDTDIANDGETALEKVKSFKPDLILLDLMLPGIDGYEVCQRIRKTLSTPIIMLSAKGEVFDKVLGLKMGADDYIMKPFDSNELVARVHAVLRRSATISKDEPASEDKPIGKANYDHDGEYVEYDNLIINISHYTVTLEGHHVEMPPKELELLYFMASRPNQVFTREQLLNQLWGYEFMGDTRTVDVHVKRLREKLSDKYNWTIATVWRIGYKFEVR
ncbi:DNA-binding response regulator, OmpR family, contains REC and winged-helix (wHTH) domain [Eubacterium ruminantium]|uniref:Stage 0 sporulation protein A homolog n=2 Tax=Eubacteriaceae TaxID=186806 RepID=A0A1T4KJC4_9FIRM|nr:DNA-binding response regulator, OmpR family, contains REC and winged-helix (wHTH) domain [Eubacterium ruminantium]SDM28318.1 DNA-binding response regulator, OmpR family, contains REC and winged-helix (wHTH) domain [Eubacterium ruminantium]SJZ42508.1 DNA-binding response regulator, OmpR family, contains REC and winged-helix (wHTH) domain [Eubacterium ruminantium]